MNVKKLAPYALILGGAYLIWSARKGGPVAGLGELGFSLKKAVSKATSVVKTVVAAPVKVAQVVNKQVVSDMKQAATDVKKVAAIQVNATKQAVTDTKNAISTAQALNTYAVSKLPGGNKLIGSKLLQTVFIPTMGISVFKKTQGGMDAATANQIVYQDSNGNVISEAEYNRLTALAQQQNSAPTAPVPAAQDQGTQAAQPTFVEMFQGLPIYRDVDGSFLTDYGRYGNLDQARSSITTYTTSRRYSTATPASTVTAASTSSQDYSSSSGGAYLDPGTNSQTQAAPATQVYEAAPADIAPAAPTSKVNPLVVVGTLVAVPALLFMTKK